AFFAEVIACLRFSQGIPPGAKRVQLNTGFLKARDPLWENSVVKNDETMGDRASSIAQGFNKAQFAAPIGRQVFDEQDPGTFWEGAFDTRVAAKALGFLSHVNHRQPEAFGDPGRKGDASRFAPGDHIECLGPYLLNRRPTARSISRLRVRGKEMMRRQST